MNLKNVLKEIGHLTAKLVHDFHLIESNNIPARNVDLILVIKVTVDRRLTVCRVESTYYTSVNSSKSKDHPIGICAFCGCALHSHQTKELKVLFAQGHRVHPNCGKQACLQLNPKANFKDLSKTAGLSRRSNSASERILHRILQ